MASFASSTATRLLEYDRLVIAGGQWWRLLSGHWTHWSLEQLAWDVAAFGALGLVCERRSRARWAATLALATVAIGAALWWGAPNLTGYRGLSGLDAALFALAAASTAGDRHAPRAIRMAAVAALVAFGAKIAAEAVTGHAWFVQDLGPGVVVVPLAHGAGAVVGLLVALTDRPARAPSR